MNCPIYGGKSGADTMRERDRTCSVLTVTVCAIGMAGFLLVGAVMRGCSRAPVPAYSMCEQCGEVIADGMQGHCRDYGYGFLLGDNNSFARASDFVQAIGETEAASCE